MGKVAILLVLYNDSDHIPRLVESLKCQTYKDFCVYAIENSAGGISIALLMKLYSSVKVFPHQGNIGFAAGNNYLAKQAFMDGADYLFVLNTDMELGSNTIEVFVNYFNNDSALGVVGSTLLIGNTNRIQLFGVSANFIKQTKEFIYPNRDINEVRLPRELKVDFVNGGSMFLSKEVYRAVGLFDEDFFMYNDEIDFAYRVKNAGFKTIVTSVTQIRHHHDWSFVNKKSYYLFTYYRMRNRMLYFKNYKYFSQLFSCIILETLKMPIVFLLNTRKLGMLYTYYTYLGLIHGIFGKKGKSNVQF